MNEIHQRVFKIWVLINFNTKTSTLWRKNEQTNVRTYEWTDELKSENYIPPHTSYVGGIIRKPTCPNSLGDGGGGRAAKNAPVALCKKKKKKKKSTEFLYVQKPVTV